jgi:hypothetical protein
MAKIKRKAKIHQLIRLTMKDLPKEQRKLLLDVIYAMREASTNDLLLFRQHCLSFITEVQSKVN